MKTNPKDHIAKVSIGIPVYNGEAFIRETIYSLLAQTYTDFELVISDNGSTDATSDICKEYAAKDNRVRYIRQPRNMGGLYNFAFVLNEARGEYFKWCAADDYVGSADYLSELVAAIEQGFECAFSDVDIVLSNDQQKTYEQRGIMTGFNSCDNALSFSKAAVKMASHQVYGLFRKAALTRCFSYIEACGHLRCFGEGLFVHAISEKLRLVYVPNVKYVYRRHKDNVSSTQPAGILLPDFMRYNKQLYGYYIRESRYPFAVRLNMIARISVAHAKYGVRLFLAVIKQCVLKHIRFVGH